MASSCHQLCLSVLLCRQKVLADVYNSNGSPIYGDLVNNTIVLFNNQRCNLTYEVGFSLSGWQCVVTVCISRCSNIAGQASFSEQFNAIQLSHKL